jgi:hypothetical protein
MLRKLPYRLAGCNAPRNLPLSVPSFAAFERRQPRLVPSCRLPPRAPCPPLHPSCFRLLGSNFQVVSNTGQRAVDRNDQLAKALRLLCRNQAPPGQPMADQCIAATHHPGGGSWPAEYADRDAQFIVCQHHVHKIRQSRVRGELHSSHPAEVFASTPSVSIGSPLHADAAVIETRAFGVYCAARVAAASDFGFLFASFSLRRVSVNGRPICRP